MRLVACDLRFSAGIGPEARGPGEAVLMNIAAGRERLASCPARAGIGLTGVLAADELERLNNLTPAAGERHDKANMAAIDR